MRAQPMDGSMAGAAVEAALRAAAFLDGVPEARIAALAARGARRRRVGAGQQVFRRGEHGHCVYVLVTGRIGVSGETTDGRPAPLDTLVRPGAFFGEGAVLGFTRRVETAVAEVESWLVELDKAVVDRLDRELGGRPIRDALRALAHRRAWRVFCAGHVYLQALSAADCVALADRTLLRRVARGQAIFEAGAAADRVVVLRAGLGRLWRRQGGRESVRGYFNAGDVFLPPDLVHGLGGEGEGRWPETLTAMLTAEVFEVERAAFMALPVDRRAVFVRALRAGHRQGDALRALFAEKGEVETMAALAAGSTLLEVLEDFQRAGALEARSLLTIDLEACVRCGNCVRACQSRHGYARMVRRGRVVAPRRDVEQAGVYRRTLMPASCQHCETPECMVDCPTGAIHRKATGEVAIEAERCIGCGHCARNCPWGNITMVPAPRAGEGLVHKLLTARLGGAVEGDPYAEIELGRLAQKCDLCAGHAQANCVHNCPTGAILRVEPARFFGELAALVGREGEAAGGGATVTDRAVEAPWWVAVLTTAGVLVGLGGLAARGGFEAASGPGRWVGAVALSGMLAASALAVRRRLAGRRRQGGRYRRWVRLHMMIGVVACGAVLLHAGPRMGGPLTALLWVFAALELLLGVGGAALYRWLPGAITDLEGESRLEEDLDEERAAIERRTRELDVEGRGARLDALGLPMPSVVECLRRRGARVEAGAVRAAGGDAEMERLYADRRRRVEIDAVRWLYRLRRIWLALHIGAAAVLTAGAVAHVLAVLRLWGLDR